MVPTFSIRGGNADCANNYEFWRQQSRQRKKKRRNRMRKSLAVLLLVLGFAASSFAQQIGPPGTVPIGVSQLHNIGNTYYSLPYQTWQAKILVGNSATGAGATIIVTAPSALADGYIPSPNAIYGANTGMLFPRLYISDAVAETITPTAVSVAACPAGTAGVIGANCATITATIANSHGQGGFVLSGDTGIAEAYNDVFLNGGGLLYWVTDTGNFTLSLAGVTTTTTAYVPSAFYSEGCAARVTTSITASTSWAVGVTGSTTSFCTAQTTL